MAYDVGVRFLRTWLVLAAVVLGAATIACNGATETPTPSPIGIAENFIMSLEGNVTKAGAPASGGALEVFTPTGVCGETTVEADGTYTLNVFGERQGRRIGCRDRATVRFRLDGVESDFSLQVSPRRRPLAQDLAFP
jgi:hypothetical protein